MILANHNKYLPYSAYLGWKTNKQKKPEKEFIGLVSFISVTFVAFVPEGMKEGVSEKPTPLKKYIKPKQNKQTF